VDPVDLDQDSDPEHCYKLIQKLLSEVEFLNISEKVAESYSPLFTTEE
jgi:hypothetical protein